MPNFDDCRLEKLVRKLGFKNIIECNGDSVRMLKVFINNNKSSSYKKKGALIYLGANNISFNLPAKLADLGYAIQRYKVYKTINGKTNTRTRISNWINIKGITPL